MSNTAITTIFEKILTIRKRPVILDSDLAAIYGTTTMALNQAVSRNKERFPGNFSFVLNREELMDLKSQNVISKGGRGGRRKPPRVFTEHGALMASTVLRSKEAVAMSVYIIEAFVKMREEMTANREILKRLAEIDKSLIQHDTALFDIYNKLLPLLEPPIEEGEKRKMGFPAD
jgi:hypothetical protein